MFWEAAEAGVGIEIQSGTFAETMKRNLRVFMMIVLCVYLLLLRKMDCKFYFASDSHAVVSIGDVLKVERYIHEIGIGKEDIFKFD